MKSACFIRSCLQLASQQELVHDSQESVNLAATLPPRRGGHRKATTPPLVELISIVSFTNLPTTGFSLTISLP